MLNLAKNKYAFITVKYKYNLNLEFFIAKRLISGESTEKRISQPIIKITIFAIALGLGIMITAIGILVGYQTEIRKKIVGFSSNFNISNYDSNLSLEGKPVSKNQNFYPAFDSVPGISHIQVYAIKPGIIKTKTDFEVVALKGVASDYDWSFFKQNLVEGDVFKVVDNKKSNNVIISKSIALRLNLKLGDFLKMYFIQDPPRARKFKISGIYATNLEEFDKKFIIVDIAHIQKLNSWSSDKVNGFEVFIDNYDEMINMESVIGELVGWEIKPDGSVLKVSSIEDKFPEIFNWLKLQDMNVVVLIILMLLVAGINIVSALLILILEKTNLIGMLKALGSSNISIRKIFIYQALLLIAKGMFWGNMFGISFCVLQSYFGFIKLNPEIYYLSQVPIDISVLSIIYLNIGTIVITFLMLILPSIIITKISPIKAINIT